MSAASRFMSWLLTERGKTFLFYSTAAFGSSTILYNYLPHNLLLPQYIDQVHLYSSGLKVPVSPEVAERFQKCVDLVEEDEFRKQFYKPFTVLGFDVFHAGNRWSHQGAAIGLPVNYSYKSVNDVRKQPLMLNLKPVDWSSTAAESLAESLIIPEKVQVFGMCREMLYARTSQVGLDTAYPIVSILAMYKISTHFNRNLRLLERPPILRYFMYSLVSAFGIGMYFAMRDFTQLYYDKKVDNEVGELGPEFIQSGVEFYDKILKRNQAMRELMGEEGPKKFNRLGNNIYFIRKRTIPLTERKKALQDKLKVDESELEEVL